MQWTKSRDINELETSINSWNGEKCMNKGSLVKLDGHSHCLEYVMRTLPPSRESACLQNPRDTPSQELEVSVIPSGKISSCLVYLIPLLIICFLLVSLYFPTSFISSPCSNTILSNRYSWTTLFKQRLSLPFSSKPWLCTYSTLL